MATSAAAAFGGAAGGDAGAAAGAGAGGAGGDAAAAAAAAAAAGAGASGGAAGAGAAAGGAGAGGEWYSSITDEPTRTWVAAKGWKDPNGLAESAYNLEKLIGHEKAGRTVVIPGADAKPEEIAAYRAKIGVPANAADYKLPVPEGGSAEFASEAATWFHEAGVPPAQAQQLAEKWNAFSAKSTEAATQAAVVKADQDFTRVIGAWGAEADANLEAGTRAARQFVPAANPQERQALMSKIELAIGTETMLKMFSAIGKGLGEHKMAGANGGSSTFGVSPEQALQRISELKGDKAWTAAYTAGGAPQKAEFERLFKIAYPETS
jgi:hypothetical protein